MLETINKDNLGEIIKLSNEELIGKVYKVETDIVYDADINPRQVDKEYAETIPLSAPPVILGILEDEEDDFYEKLIIIDGNHRMYSWKNIHNSKYCLANIIKYKTMDDAIIDAFKFNINHGRRLSDKEIYNGIKRIVVSLRKKNKDLTYSELSQIINISKSSISEYVHWNKIEVILNENNNGEEKKIEKIKANTLYYILQMENKNIDIEKRKEYIRIFYNLTKELSTRKTKELIKYFLKTERICNYEEYMINKSLEVDSADDKITEKSKEIIANKVEQVNNESIIETPVVDKEETNVEKTKTFVKVEEPISSTKTEIYKEPEIMNFTKNKELTGFVNEEVTEEIPDPDDFIQTTINQPIVTNETIGTEYIEETNDDKQEVSAPMITRPTTVISNNVGKKIDFTLKKDNKEHQEDNEQKSNNENELVTYKGNVRPLKFTTVLENIVTDLQEDVISSNSLLTEVLDKNLHFHRKEFEQHKGEYLTILNNVYSLVKKMMLKLSKANKDFDDED